MDISYIRPDSYNKMKRRIKTSVKSKIEPLADNLDLLRYRMTAYTSKIAAH